MAAPLGVPRGLVSYTRTGAPSRGFARLAGTHIWLSGELDDVRALARGLATPVRLLEHVREGCLMVVPVVESWMAGRPPTSDELRALKFE